MHSHRRPRGQIFFEVLCAVSVGASFVGAWIQTGAWAFLAPAFVFTLFGLYWSFDMFGRREPVPAAVQPASAPAAVRLPDPEPVAMMVPEPALPAPRDIEILAIEEFVAAEVEPVPVEPLAPEPAAVAVAAPEAAAPAKPKRRARKAKPAEIVVAAAVEVPDAVEAPDAPYYDEPAHNEPHIEPLFDPQPFARQVRPAFGKRSRGPGPRPLPA